ncbi:MAG: invasion associated locus B family protein [Rhodospirillales bacterium]|nr:invasion associated locus B family protein [Rhodospirillales bacterium]MCB9995024.1 invasion associated locus B family protein [Rhodospirillales bacterium]
MSVLIRHKMKFICTILVALAMTAALGLSGTPVASQEPQATPAPGSAWTVRCQEQDKGHCEIFQRLVVQETGKRMAEFAIGFPEDKKTARGVMILPLGILLTDGVQMQIDDQQPFKFKVRFCTNDGCFAYLNLNDAVLGMLQKGNKATIRFKSMQGQEIDLPISLSGFTKALQEIG